MPQFSSAILQTSLLAKFNRIISFDFLFGMPQRLPPIKIALYSSMKLQVENFFIKSLLNDSLLCQYLRRCAYLPLGQISQRFTVSGQRFKMNFVFWEGSFSALVMVMVVIEGIGGLFWGLNSWVIGFALFYLSYLIMIILPKSYCHYQKSDSLKVTTCLLAACIAIWPTCQK